MPQVAIPLKQLVTFVYILHNRLQRSSTVQLWEKEKEKVLAKAKEREEQLKREFEELKQTYDELRERTTNRIRVSILMTVKTKALLRHLR